jgi:hypothetical protein
MLSSPPIKFTVPLEDRDSSSYQKEGVRRALECSEMKVGEVESERVKVEG